MTVHIIVFSRLDFDGTVSVRCADAARARSINYQLLRDGEAVAERVGAQADETVRFDNQLPGTFQVKAQLNFADGTTSTLESASITIQGSSSQGASEAPNYVNLKGGHHFYDNVENYYLEVKFRPRGLDRLMQEREGVLPIYHGLTAGQNFNFSLVYDQDVLTKPGRGHFADFYRIDARLTRENLLRVAEELESLPYVIYCSVTPDTTGLRPPEDPPRAETSLLERSAALAPSASTPDFSGYQGYLEPGKGMNVHDAWKAGHSGRGVTVRHLDFGVYKQHEDLGNISVVNSRKEEEDCNHGTASTGCIAATRNAFGVTGIAHDCSFFFYDTGDMDRIVADAGPGDIIGLDIQFEVDKQLIPVIDNKSWWDKINTLHESGATVVVAAANGGLDLGGGIIRDYGDSGSLLAGACNHNDGRRASFSNYGHYTSFVNSWGDWSVATTGYSDLQESPDHTRSYTKSYSGTSSATPLSVGALAVLQGYAISTYNKVLTSDQWRKILENTGYKEAEDDSIGWRPNVYAALPAIDALLS